jgi:ferritin-like metal-binding protein YciE
VEQTALKQLYVDNLRDLQSAENELVEVLPKLARRGHVMNRVCGYGEPHRTPECQFSRLKVTT